MTKILFYILVGTGGMYMALHGASERDYKTATVYDGCYEQYVSYDIQAEDFTNFMTDCMSK
jgi:hypothetical protein